VKQIPVKADIEAQETFKTEVLEPLVEQAQAGKIHLFFVDAAHFVMLPFLGYLYSLTVRFIKVASGRKRFSVLGALNAVTKDVVTITDHGYINALSVCELLQKLHDQFRCLPIVLIMDNARYQHCALVIEKASKLKIQIVFLPPYSPNLNLIERLWKFVKKKTLILSMNSSTKLFQIASSKLAHLINKTWIPCWFPNSNPSKLLLFNLNQYKMCTMIVHLLLK